jgi:hypothetical protein
LLPLLIAKLEVVPRVFQFLDERRLPESLHEFIKVVLEIHRRFDAIEVVDNEVRFSKVCLCLAVLLVRDVALLDAVEIIINQQKVVVCLLQGLHDFLKHSYSLELLLFAKQIASLNISLLVWSLRLQ